MGNIRITALIVFIGLVIASLTIIPASAMVTQGYCTDAEVYLGGSCTIIGLLESGDRNSSVFKVEDIDLNPPYQAEMKISGWWDNLGVFGYDEIISAGNTYTYTNPSDSNDFIQFQVTSIFGGGDNPFVELGDVNYQQTFYVSTGGSDSNNGNVPGNSWLTMTKAMSSVYDGVDVIVSSGTYVGGVIDYTGVLDSPIIFKSNDHATITENIAETYKSPFQTTSNKDYIEISGFNITVSSGTAFGVRYMASGTNTYGWRIYNNDFYNYQAIPNINIGNTINIIDYQIYGNTIHTGDGVFIQSLNTCTSGNIYNNTFLSGSISTVTNCLPYSGTIGNYYYNYAGIDENGDKIGDTSHNGDLYPKMDRESGYVKNAYGIPVDNATVTQISATYRNTTSDANGYYALSTIGRDTVTLYAIKDAVYGNATVNYDAVNANITIGVSGYNNTNTIIFSSDSNPDNVITSVPMNVTFWVNTWEAYDTSGIYHLDIYYPDGSLVESRTLNPVGVYDHFQQNWFNVNWGAEPGTYLFRLIDFGNLIELTNATIDVGAEDTALIYFSSDLSGLNRISSALFNHTVYLQISHMNANYINYSYNISILTPTNTPFYNWTTTTEYGYASWYTPSTSTGTWTVNFIRKNLSNNSELIMNTTTLYLSQEETPPPINLSVLSGYVREAGSLNAIYQASVVAGSYSASTNALGYYIITNMLDGNYTITASKTGYNSSSTNRTIANGSISNVNFILNCAGACPTPTPTPTGTGTGTPTPTSTGGGIIPGSTTDETIASNFWTMLFLVLVLYIIAFFWTIGDKE
jgi:hypothetical protein